MKRSSSTKLLDAGLHFGDVRDAREVAGLICVESEYAPRLATPLHAHETASFTMVIRGGYREQFQGRTFECLPGKVLFRASGQPHCDRMSDRGAHCLMIELRQSWQERMLEGGLRITTARQLADASHFVAEFRRELLTNDSATALAVESLVLELICKFVRRVPETDSTPLWLSRLHDRLKAEYAEKVSLRELASDSRRHPAHVARMFRKHYQCSIGDFLRRHRIANACERIRAGQALSAVAIEAGFANQAHFSRLFRAMIGTTPREYRDRSRKAGTNAHLP